MNGAERKRAPYLTTQDISKWLGVATRTICLWAECKEIPAIKIGRQWRFLEVDIRRWLVESDKWQQISPLGMRLTDVRDSEFPPFPAKQRPAAKKERP